MTQFTYRLPPRAWNNLLFRYYRNRDEFFDAGKSRLGEGDRSRAATAESMGSKESDALLSTRSISRIPKSISDSKSTLLDTASRYGEDDLRSEGASTIGASTKGSRRAISKSNFRMRWGMLVEWRVRISDGFLWSPWSSISQPAGLVPPIPAFTTHMHLDFSRWEPTIARLSWGIVSLPPGYEHLDQTVEYVVYMESDANSARDVLQAGRGTFSPEDLRSKGIRLSEGTCGLVTPIDTNHTIETEGGIPTLSGRAQQRFDLNNLFDDSSERRIVGKFSGADAKWINFAQEGNNRPVTGFELCGEWLTTGERSSLYCSCTLCVSRSRCAGLAEDEN